MSISNEPNRCVICSYYLTIAQEYVGHRCVDPGHWQAAGLLTSNDFYSMACLAASAFTELNYRDCNRQ